MKFLTDLEMKDYIYIQVFSNFSNSKDKKRTHLFIEFSGNLEVVRYRKYIIIILIESLDQK